VIPEASVCTTWWKSAGSLGVGAVLPSAFIKAENRFACSILFSRR
jgi:hypothetical protein